MASSDVVISPEVVENSTQQLNHHDAPPPKTSNATITTPPLPSSSLNNNNNNLPTTPRQLPKPPITPRGGAGGAIGNKENNSTPSTPIIPTTITTSGKQLPPITNIIRNRIDLEEREKENQQNILAQQHTNNTTTNTPLVINNEQQQSITEEEESCFFEDEIQEYKTPPKQSSTSSSSTTGLPPPPPSLPSSMSKLAQHNVQSKINNINSRKGGGLMNPPPPPLPLTTARNSNAPPPLPIFTITANNTQQQEQQEEQQEEQEDLSNNNNNNNNNNRQERYKPLPSLAKYKRDSVVIPANLANLPPPQQDDLKAFLDIYDNKILIVDSRAFSNSKSVSEQLISRFTLRTLTIDSILGRGCSGSVYLCSENGEKLAVKIVTPTATFIPNVKGEYELMKSLDHESIMKVYDYFEMLTSLQPGSLFTMKYYQNGDLRKMVEDYEKRERKISIHLIYDFIYQMASSLSFIHNQKIIHRDLKPENIFMEKQTEHTCKIVLGDFGLAKAIQQSHGLFSIVGTMNYLSPEIVNNSEYGAETDIWSFGVVCYELMTLKSKQVERVVTLRQQGALVNDMLNRYPQEVTMIELIVQMLNKNPADRPSADEILKQPCMKHFIEIKKVCEHIVQRLTESLAYFQKNYEFEKCIQIKDLLQSIGQLRAESCDSSRLRISLYNAYTFLEEKLPENIDLKPTKPKVNLAASSSPEKQVTPSAAAGKKRSNTKAGLPSPPPNYHHNTTTTNNHQHTTTASSSSNQHSTTNQTNQTGTTNNFRVTISGDESSDISRHSEESENSSGSGSTDSTSAANQRSTSNGNSLELEESGIIRKRSSSRNNIINQIKGWVAGYGMEKDKSFKQNIVIKPPDPNKFHHEHHIGIDDRNRVSGNYPKDYDNVLHDMHKEPLIIPEPPNEDLKPSRLHRRSTSLFEKPSINEALEEIVSSPTRQLRTGSNATAAGNSPRTIPKELNNCPPLSPSSTKTPSTPSNSEILKISPRIGKAGKLEVSPLVILSENSKSPNTTVNGVEIPNIGGAFKLISGGRQQDIIENCIEEACSSPTVARRRR